MSIPNRGGGPVDPRAWSLIAQRRGEGVPDRQIVCELGEQFGIRPIRARRDIARYDYALMEAEDEETQLKRAKIIGAYWHLYMKAMQADPPHLKTAASILDSLCKIHGFNAAERLEIVEGLSAEGEVSGRAALLKHLRELEGRPLPELMAPSEPKHN